MDEVIERMKTIILAGGLGTRLSEETAIKPKPMVEIGGKPILWHILNIYAAFGYNDFVIACGYKSEIIKEYFANFHHHNNDLIVDLKSGNMESVGNRAPDWRVHCVDTGVSVMTGGRLLRMRDLLGQNTFMVTYGDGLGNIDIKQLIAFHKSHGKKATVTAVRPPTRFGGLELEGDRVIQFSENSPGKLDFINGGFFVFEPSVLEYIEGDETQLESTPLSRLADDGEFMAFRHEGFWQPMDTLREKTELERLWSKGDAPWKIW